MTAVQRHYLKVVAMWVVVLTALYLFQQAFTH